MKANVIKTGSISDESCEFKGTSTYCFNYITTDEYRRKVIVPYGPSGNCQWFCIRNFQQFNDLELESASILLKKICYKIGKQMFMIDIKTYLLEGESVISKLLEDTEIMLNTPYLSTNGSKMTMMLVKSRKFIDYEGS